MKNKCAFSVLLLILIAVTTQAQRKRMYEVFSPGKSVKLVLAGSEKNNQNGGGPLTFKLLYKVGNVYKEILPYSPLGITTEDRQFSPYFVSSACDNVLLPALYFADGKVLIKSFKT